MDCKIDEAVGTGDADSSLLPSVACRNDKVRGCSVAEQLSSEQLSSAQCYWSSVLRAVFSGARGRADEGVGTHSDKTPVPKVLSLKF